MLDLTHSIESNYISGVILVLVAGFMIGYDRAAKGEPAGVRTHTLVCLGAMLFSTISQHVDPGSPSRIAANIVVGMGFLGAGIIMHAGGTVRGLTSAASLWMIAAIGTAIGFGFNLIALLTIIVAWLILKMPHIGENRPAAILVSQEHALSEENNSKSSRKRRKK